MSERQATSHTKRSKPAYSCWVWGLVGVVLAVLLLAFLFPIPAKRSRHCPHVMCLYNLKQIGLASRMYAEDHDEVFVRMPEWDDALEPYLKSRRPFHCPQNLRKDTLSYGLNPYVAGRALSTWDSRRVGPSKVLPPGHVERVVTFYDGVGAVVLERHKDGANYAFVDGHSKWLPDPPEDSGLFVPE